MNAKPANPTFLAAVERSRAAVREIDVTDLQRRRAAGEALHLVDVREDDEWRRGHADGALHIGRGVLERDIGVQIPDRLAVIILYSDDGYRSILAAHALGQLGYESVFSLRGGLNALRGTGPSRAQAPT